ncbi:MAG: DUF262 domain-containing protein [Lentisphaeria bacterium]|nr:DUF262 domain-containing protein [Lentisphaeria bacterium]
MKIELHELTIREIAENYTDNNENGVTGYNGKLNIRPKYQREFVYDDKKRNAVIETIIRGFPLNVMYWVKNSDDDFEILDGQQRTISFCQYINGDFSLNNRAFHNLTKPEQQQILDYKVMVYFCEGNDKEKLDWFQTINIAGEKLTDQELRNAVYTGSWLADAKLKFSKSNCAAYLKGNKYLNAAPIRQEYLETALKWINNGKIEEYMSQHQHDPNANELFSYFLKVIDWVEMTFVKYRKEMKGIEWGPLYNQFKDIVVDTADLEKEISALMVDDDVTNRKGIYTYVLTRQEKYLSVRAFDNRMKRTAYERQAGICKICGKYFEIEEMEADHITPWSQGGKTLSENCQMLCRECNRRKSDI